MPRQLRQPRTAQTVLALDLGTRTGWALQTRAGRIISGTQSFKPSRFEGGGMRYLRFMRWLEQLHGEAGELDVVVFEEVRRHAGTDAAHCYGGLLATLTAACEASGIAYQGVPVAHIKRYATGKGNAAKHDVIGAMRAKGYAPRDDNEADALALMHYALEHGVVARGGRS